jgi:hypothetical protein
MLCEYKKRLHYTNSDDSDNDGIPSYFLDAALKAGLQDALQQVMKRDKSTSG